MTDGNVRPALTAAISVEDFCDFDWLKVELLTFCRQHKLPSSGAKQVLSAHIVHFLRTGEVLPRAPHTTKKGRDVMPNTFTRETRIAAG